jgi:PilZ domain
MIPDASAETTLMPSQVHLEASSERRRKPRINTPFPARVKGVDVDGRSFEVNTILDNLSSDGCYLRIMPCVAPGMLIEVVFRLLATLDDVQPRAINVRGTVLRADERPGGACGVAMLFNTQRFL